jgi:hypothetical protein
LPDKNLSEGEIVELFGDDNEEGELLYDMRRDDPMYCGPDNDVQHCRYLVSS